MKYYLLTFSSNVKEVGKIPQSEECLIGDIQQDFIPWEGVINFGFKLPEPNLEKKSKQTSYLNVVAIPSFFLVIDDELLNFLRGFKICNYQDWKINTWLNKKEITKKYNLFLLNDTKQSKYIDFKKSEFYSKKLGDWNNSSIQKSVFVKDYDEYIFVKEKLRKDKLMLLHKNVTLDLSKTKVDLFRIVNAPPGGYFVSEKLKNAIAENGFTGMEFTEVSELNKVEVIY
ncbi:hypothetical protein [Formosa haliotis]|uniref:hypothetical protein n=1 Tax=Formosa haliotis TaxID=1555194 RepID=UPI0008244643|nr:hypothetical protein [Formosa haliotis]